MHASNIIDFAACKTTESVQSSKEKLYLAFEQLGMRVGSSLEIELPLAALLEIS